MELNSKLRALNSFPVRRFPGCLYHLGLDSPRSLSRPSAIIKFFLFEKMKKAQPHPLPVGILLPLLDSVRFHRNQEHSSGPHDRKFPRETQEPECSCGSNVHFPITLYTVETRTSRAVQCWDTPHTKGSTLMDGCLV